MERIPSGIPGIDKLLGGGLPRGRTILLSGSCGTGKTIFASQFINQGLKKGEHCVYITLEEDKKKMLEDLKEIGIDFKKHNRRLTLIGGPVGHVKYFKDKTKADMNDMVNEISEIVKDHKARRVVLDSVNLFTMLFENNLERRKALAELTSVLEDLDCTTFLTCEVQESSDDISWYGFEEFVVDGVISLKRIPFENMFERAVSIVKMRGIGHQQVVRALRITDKGMKVYPDQEPFHKTPDKEKK